MKNFILVLLALPGWVAAQTDSNICLTEIVDTSIQLATKCQGPTLESGCCPAGIIYENGPDWCHDHSHCIHRHNHRNKEADHAKACAGQCQQHANYRLQHHKEAARLLDRPIKWAEDADYYGWYQIIRMPFPFSVYGQEVHLLEFWENNYLSLMDAHEHELMEVAALNTEEFYHRSFRTYQSQLSYQMDGIQGDRILKIQFQGLHSKIKEVLIYQVWLHEATNEISLHYIQMPVDKKDEHFELSLSSNCQTGMHELYVAGLSNNPMVQCASQYMCGLPENGTVYSLKPVHLVLPERKLAVSQTPSFSVKVEQQSGLHQLVGLVGTDELQLFDSQGRLVKRILVEQARQGFLLDDCAAGVYLLHDPLFGQSTRILNP